MTKSKIKKPYPSIKIPLIIVVVVFAGLLFLLLYLKRNTFFKSQASVEGHFMTTQVPPETRSIIVKYKTNKIPIKQSPDEDLKELKTRRAYTLTFSSSEKAQRRLEELKKDSDVEFVEPDHKLIYYMTPNDEYYFKQWALPKIQMPPAWDITQGENVKVAVVDSGISQYHPDVSAQVEKYMSVLPSDITIYDELGHGTHIAGIIGAITNNSWGIAGISPKIKLMSIKIGQYDISMSNGADGIRMAVDNGAQIINLSWGSKNNSQYLHDAINYALSKDVTVVVAAGNSGNNIKDFPASYDGVISVAATDELDNKARFSTFGNWVDIAAPGVNILSTVLDPNILYEKWDGTSMAAPHVVGVAALIKSQNPGISRQDIESTLCSSADKIMGTGKNWICGRLNAFNALSKSTSPTPTTVSSPTPTNNPSPTPVTEGCQITLSPSVIPLSLGKKVKLEAIVNSSLNVKKVVFSSSPKLFIYPKTDNKAPFKTNVYSINKRRRVDNFSSLFVKAEAYLNNSKTPSCSATATVN